MQATKSSNVTYTIRISSLELYNWVMCCEWFYSVNCINFLSFQLAYPSYFMFVSLCVPLCNDHLLLVWAEQNPDEETSLLDRSWSWLGIVSQPKSWRDDKPKIKFEKEFWSRHHSYYRKLWKTIKKEQGLRKTRFWVRESVTRGEGISTPQRSS